MAEKRYHDFGRFVRAIDQNEVQNFLFEAGVLQGMELSVTGDGLQIIVAAGQAIMQDGVIVSNNSARYINFTRTIDARLYTIVLVHQYSSQQGGTESSLELREMTDGGLPIFGEQALNGSSEVEGIVIGWVNYPGGSVDPSQEMLFEAAKQRIQVPNLNGLTPNPNVDDLLPINIRPPYLNSPHLLVVEDVDVTAVHSVGADLLPLTTWTNNSGVGAETVTLLCTPKKPAAHRPKEVTVEVEAPGVSGIEVFAIVNGVSTSIGSVVGPLTGEQTFRVDDSLFPDSPQTAGTAWGFSVVISIAATLTAAVTLVRVNAGPKPLEP